VRFELHDLHNIGGQRVDVKMKKMFKNKVTSRKILNYRFTEMLRL